MLRRRSSLSPLKQFANSLRRSGRRRQRISRSQQAAAGITTANAAKASETLEDRVLLAGVNDDPTNPAWQQTVNQQAADDVLSLLKAAESITVAQSTDASSTTSLAGIGKSLNELLTDSNGNIVPAEALSLHTDIANFVGQFSFVAADAPTVHELAVQLDNALQPFGGQVDVDLADVTSDELDLQILIDRSITTNASVALPTAETSVQQDLEISGNVDVTVAASFQAHVSLNVSLSAAVSRPDASLLWNNWQASADFTNSTGTAVVDYHFAELTSESATAIGQVNVTASVTDPSAGTAGISRSELAASNHGMDLRTDSNSGILQFELPLATNLTGFTVPVGHNPSITLTDSNLFDSDLSDSSTSVTDFDSLQPFAEMDAARFQSSLESVINALNEVDASSLLNAEIALTNGRTLNELIDVSDVFTKQVLTGLVQPGALELSISSNVADWAAITDGSLSIAVDAETITLHSIDFSSSNSMNDVAAILEAAINDATNRVANVTVVFDPSTSRTDNNGNTSSVHTLTITSSGITSSAAVTSPAAVVVTNSEGDDEIVGTSLIGLAANHVINSDAAVVVASAPVYQNAQQFRDVLRDLTGGQIADVAFVPATASQPPTLRFEVAIDETLSTVRTSLNLPDADHQLSHLTTQSTIDLTPRLQLSTTIDVELSPIGGNFVLTTATTLAELNAGRGVRLNRARDAAVPSADGSTDVEVILRDTTSFEVNFDDAVTVGDIIDRYNNHTSNVGGTGPDGRKLTVKIAADQQSLSVTDHTTAAATDPPLFRITPINGSLAAYGLGLAGSAAAEDDANTTDVNEATTIRGAALHGLTVADHVLMTDLTIQPSVALLAQDVTATAQHGFVEIDLSQDTTGNQSAIAGTFGQVLNYGSPAVSAGTLIDDLNGDSALGTSTVNANIDLRMAATVGGPIATDIDISDATVTGTVNVVSGTTAADYLTNGATTNLALNDASELEDLANASLTDVVSSLSDLGDLLSQLLQVDALDIDLPLLGVSVAELASIGAEIGSIADILDSNPTTSLQQIEELIEDALGLADVPGVPVFALPVLNTAAGRSYLNRVPEHFQPARLAAGDPVSQSLRTLDYLATQQHDSPEVGLSIDRNLVTRNVSDYSSAELQALLEQHGITLDAGATTFEIPGFSLRLDFALDFTASDSKFAANLDADPDTTGIQVPLHFALEDFGLNLPSVIDVSGESLITVDVGTTLQLSMGLDLTSPTGITPFVYQYDEATGTGTTVLASLTAIANDISFHASIGPFGASIDTGILAFTSADPFSDDFHKNNTPAAEFRLDFVAADHVGNADGRLTIAEALNSNASDLVTTSVAAFAFAELPTFFPTADNHLGDFQLAADLSGLAGYFSDSSGHHTTNGTNGLSVSVTDGDNQPVFIASMPEFESFDLKENLFALVGGWEGVFDVIIGAMRGEVLGVHIPLIGDALSDEAQWLEDIRDTVVDTFGAADGSNPTLDQVTNVLYSALGPDGVHLLTDANEDDEITVEDIGLELTTGAGSIVTGILFHLPLGRKDELLSESVAFDLGVPGLGLEVDGDVRLEADFRLDLGIGLSVEDGVYIDTSADNELELSIEATVPDLTAKGTLGFLQLDVSDDAASPSHVGASFTVDLRDVEDSEGNTDDKLTLAEMFTASPSDLLSATVTAGANVNLDLIASFDGDANFPRLRTDFAFEWDFAKTFGADADTATHDSTSPTVRFDNVGLSLGEFINQFVNPIVEQARKITEPIQPILDALNSEVPVVSEILAGATWLDLAEMFGGAEVAPFVEALELLDQIVDVTDRLSGTGDDLWIELGTFTVLGDEAINPDMAGQLGIGSSSNPAVELADQLVDMGAAEFNELLNDATRQVISFPLLEHPTNAFQLLLGQDVDLVIFDFPELNLDFEMAYRIFFPPFPVLYAEIGGGVETKINFDFGYDTAGLRKFVSTLDPLDIAEGFYISDRENADGTGADIPEAAFTGIIYVQGGLDAGIFEAGVRGQLTATLDFNLHDYPDEFSNQTDGKVRADELIRSLKLSPQPLQIFDIGGAIDAGLSAFLKIDLGLFTISKTFDIASVHLLDYSLHRPAEDRPLLATKNGDTLTLNMTGAADHYVVLPGTDPNDSNRVVVRGFRPDGSVIDTQGFAGITQIVGLGSAGADIVEIDSRLQQTVELHGGEGNDHFTAGSGRATFYGDAGDDVLIGGSANDVLDGGAGDDVLTAIQGHNTLQGGSGVDTLTTGDGHDTIEGGDGNDLIFSGAGDDHVHGGAGDDKIYGEDGNDRLFGDAGEDVLIGANGRDWLDGGADNDRLEGGLLADTLIGGSGDDFIDGGVSNDLIYGNAIGTIELATGFYNDSGTGNNTIFAGAGSDRISTGTGNDQVYAGGLNAVTDHLSNIIHAAGGDNVIVGDAGPTSIVAGPGIDTITTLGGDDVIVGGAGDDIIDSGSGDDVIVGGFGDDTITTVSGNNIVWGGLLPATLSGIDPTSTILADKTNQTVAVFNRTLKSAVSSWAFDADIPPEWTEAEAANPTGFDIPAIMPAGMNGQSIEGTPLDGNDTITTGDGDDVIFGGSDQDLLHGGHGNDFVDAGAGNDDVFGGDGRDVLLGGANNDRVFGNAGIDQVYGGFGDDILFAGAGETIQVDGVGQHSLAGQRSWGGDGVDYLYAYAQVGNDAPAGFIATETTLAGDEMHGGSGGDFLFGNLRAEKLFGGDGNDSIFGDWLAGPETPAGTEDGLPFENTHKATVGGNDVLLGGSGEDTLTGGGGNDELYGGADSDRLEGQDGIDSLFGGDWIDLLVLDVSPHYAVNGSADNVDGHGPAAPNVFTTDDNATDILVIEGDADRQPGQIDSTNDTIQVGQDGSGQLVVLYNGRVIEARWLDAFAKPLVEQFELDGLTGDDRLEFLTAAVTVTGPNNQPLVVRPLDVSRLADRSDFVGVLNGGPGDDILRGTAARDRIDGSSGSDVLFGFGGDDRLWGGSDGSANDHDVLYAGQGNDDLIGGSGSNEIFAWSHNPSAGQQFGLFVNANGELVTDNGDLDGDGFLDADGVSRPLQPENTGLNRMLGNLYEDDLYGGTGLDFIFGNGGNDRTFRADGTLFNSTDQDLGGDSWVQYARENSGVWYVGGSAREDTIQLNYVTEEGLLNGRHVVTRSTTIVDQNGVPRTTFDVSANLNFGATDSNGNLIWDASRRAWNAQTNSFANDDISLSNVLPPEGVVQAVIIDALGGDDTVIVGETVQATVWVSAGTGNDYVEIKSGNALLPDETEAGSRNDSLATAFELVRPELPAVLQGNLPAPSDGVLDSEANFTIKVNDSAPIAVTVSEAAILGIDGSYANENIDDLLFDINASLQTAGLQSAVTATKHGDRILFVSNDRGDNATLRIRANADDPIVRQLGFVSDFVATGTSSTSEFQFNDLTIDGISDADFYRIHLTEDTGQNSAVTINSATLEDGLTVSLYEAVDSADPRLIAVNADQWDSPTSRNDSVSAATNLADVQTLLGIEGLTLTTGTDVDFFTFTTDTVGRRTDKLSIRQTDGDTLLAVSLTDSLGQLIEATIKDGSDNLVQEFSLEDIAAGTFTLRISSLSAARYELIPSIGSVGTRKVNLNAGAASSVSMAGLSAGTYFVKVATPNALPTVYNMSFNLDLPNAISVPAIGLADTSFHVDRRDVVTGGDGHDVLIGGLGEDWIFGGDGNDVLSGGLDQQASDLLFGGSGSDTFQILPDQLPNLHGSNQTFVPTFNDRFDGGDGEDRILYLGGDYTTNPITGASVAIPDYVSMRFNSQLHRYEFTSLRWDIANERFAVAENGKYEQHYSFFQASNIEATVIDGQAGNDVVRADAEYKFPNTDSEWGIKRGNAQQGGTLGALTIEGGDGDDILFGGDLNDIIDGGSGDDIIVGGLGDDLLFGGGGNDYLAGQHAGDETPTFTDDDIAIPELTNPADLPAMNHVPVYRAVPIATTGVRTEAFVPATVNDSTSNLDDAATLNVESEKEYITAVSAVGDLNADGFDDFVVSTNLMHYVFFGPVDLTSLVEIAARSAVDPHRITGRADVLIDAAVGSLESGIANINGDFTGEASVTPVHDLVFVKQDGNIATINVLFGGASIRDGEADTFWPRSMGEFNTLDAFNWRSVNVILPTANTATVELLNYTRSDTTDVMLVAAGETNVMQATVVSGASITGWDTQGSVNGTTVEPTTTFHLPVPDSTAANIQAVGDMNGDGLDDVAAVIAARPEVGEHGTVYIHYARPDAPVSVELSAGYDRLLTDDYLAGFVTAAGDLNSDGYDDVLLRQQKFDPATVNGSGATNGTSEGETANPNQELNIPTFAGNLRGQVEESASLDPTHALTVQMWIKTDRFANEWMPVFINDSNGSSSTRTVTIWVNRAGYFHFTSAATGHDQNYMNVYPSEGHIQTNQWYHISGTIDRITGVQSFYINGQLAETQSVVTGSIVQSTRGLRIGNTIDSPGSYTAFHGAIADVRYFGRALPAEEIAAEYNSTTMTDQSDLIAWYRMHEDSGSRLIDSSANANHGVYRSGGKGADRTIIEPDRAVNSELEALRIPVVRNQDDGGSSDGMNQPTAAAANPSDRLVVVYGEADNVVDFNGQKLTVFNDNNYAVIPHTDDLVPTRQLTLSAWVYVDDQSNGWTPVVFKSDAGVAERTYSLWYHSHGFFQFTSTAEGTRTTDYIQQPDGQIAKHRWYHVAGVVNRDDRTISLYVDGKLVQTKTGIHSGDNYDSTAPVYIGATPPNSDTSFNTFYGVISNLRLRDRALTAEEVEADRLQFTTAVADTSLVLELPMANPTGRTFTDTSNNGHDAYFRHAESFALPTDDLVDVVTRVDRTYPGIVAQDTPSVQLDASTLNGREEFTVELQFRTPAANSTVQTLLSAANEFSDNEFTVFLHPDGRIEVVDQGASTFWQMPFNAADNQWHDLTVIRRASDVAIFAAGAKPLTQIVDHIATDTIDTSVPVRGKVIRIEKRLIDENIISLGEVVIRNGDGVNVATLGTATQSTTRTGSGGNVASKAIDGNTSGYWSSNSVTHTAVSTDAPAWWQVELAEETDIHSIEIFNRRDNAEARLSNVRISVLDEDGSFVWAHDLGHVSAYRIPIYDVTTSNENLAIVNVDRGNETVRAVEVIVAADARQWDSHLTAANGQIVPLEIVPGTINRLRPVNTSFNGTIATGNWSLTARSTDVATPILLNDWSLRLETLSLNRQEDDLRYAESTVQVAGIVDDAATSLPVTGLSFRLDVDDYSAERNFTATITSPTGTVANIGNRTTGSLNDFNGEDPNGDWLLSVDTGDDATNFKLSLNAWELDVLTGGSELILDGHSLGQQLSPSQAKANDSAAEPNRPIAASGRYIRIAATETGQTLAIADVSVLDLQGRHVAVYGTATASGQEANNSALAIDTGAPAYQTFAVAEADANGNAWWMLDLGTDVDISDVQLTLADDVVAASDQLLVSIVQDDGTVDFRNVMVVREIGLLTELYDYNYFLGDFPHLDSRQPNIVRFDATINHRSTSSNFAGTGWTTNYAGRYSGQILIADAGDVTFFIDSDDGSKLLINGEELIVNGGSHGMREYSGTINLSAGYHDIRIEHFNGGGPGGLIFSYQPEGQSKQVVPSSVLSTGVRSVFANSDLQTKSISLELNDVAGDVLAIEVGFAADLSSASHREAWLVAPNGQRVELTSIAGSSNRMVAESVDGIASLNGTWSLVKTWLSSEDHVDLFTEFDLLLTTNGGSDSFTAFHEFSRNSTSSSLPSTDADSVIATRISDGPLASGTAVAKSASTSERKTGHHATGQYVTVSATADDAVFNVSDVVIYDLFGNDVSSSAAIQETVDDGIITWTYDLGEDILLSDVRLVLSDRTLEGSEAVVTIVRNDGSVDTTNVISTKAAGVMAEFFDWGHSLSTLPNLNGRTPDLVLEHDSIDFADTAEGFAGSSYLDHFAVRWTGQIYVPAAGEVRFYINSDDGSLLDINGHRVTTDNGVHALQETSGTRFLNAGYHAFNIEFFENGGLAGMIFSYQLPGEQKVVVPVEALNRPDVSGLTSRVVPAVKGRLDLPALDVADGGFVLGQDQDRVGRGFDAKQGFIGQMDSVRIWDHAVTSEEASTLAGRRLSLIDDTTGLIAVWNFDEVQGTAVVNAVDADSTSTIVAVSRAVKSTVNPYVSSAPQVLTLADQAVRLPYETLDGQAEFTIELQLRFDPDALTKENVFFSTAGSRSYNEFTLWMEADGRLLLTDAGADHYWNLEQPITDGDWHDVSIVRHQVDDNMVVDIYVDGAFQGRRNVGNHALRVSKHGIVLGQDQDSIGWSFQSSQAFHGDLDNIRIWQTVRTPEQIVSGLGGQIVDPRFNENLAGYWTFNGLDSSLFKDESSYGRAATNYTGSHAASQTIGGSQTAAKTNPEEAISRSNHLSITLADDLSIIGSPLFGDVNGDNHEDLVIHATGLSDSDSVLLISNVAAWDQNSQVAATDPKVSQILSSTTGSFDVHAMTDIDADGFADVLLTTDGGTKFPVLFGEADQVQVPKNFDVIANRTVTGSGDFVVDKGEAEQFDFEFTADDVQPDGRSLRWVRFTTLGDGYASTTSDIDAGTWVRLSASVRADLVSANGSVVARNFWTLDLSQLAAGTYYLKVTTFAAEESAKFAITMRAPLAGTSWQPTDRDQIYAGEGDDWISGGAFKDIIFGNGADHAIDTVISEPLEYRDPDSVTIDARTITVGGQQIDLPAETYLLEDRTNPAASETSTTPVTSLNCHLLFQDLTADQLVLLGHSNFEVTLGADGRLRSLGTITEATLQNAERESRSISGRIFDDANNDGLRSHDEEWLNAMVVTLVDSDGNFAEQAITSDIDFNGDGFIDPETERGWYTFAGLELGDYRVVKQAQVGWAQTSPSFREFPIAASTTVDGLQSQSVDFGVRTLAPGSISGTLFNDANDNSVQEASEVGLSGWKVSLIDAGGYQVAETTTDAAGAYEFNSLVPGNYFVVREDRAGWGPDAGQWEAVRSLIMGRLGITFDPAVISAWDSTSPLILPSRTGLWYAFTADGRLLQGTTAENAATGQLVRDFTSVMNGNQTLPQNVAAMAQIFLAAGRNVSVTESTQTDVMFRARQLQPGSVTGTVFNDANSNSIQDSDEVSRSNVTVELLDDDGTVAYSTTTDSSGRYTFSDVVVGSYYVLVTPEEGWRQTSPAVNPVAHAAYNLDQELGLQHTGKYFENWGNLGEKWLNGTHGWYFITPDGAIYEWNNSPLDDLSGRYLQTLNPQYHQNPELLFEAIAPGAIRIVVAENQTSVAASFLVTELPTATVQGSVYHDADGNGLRTSDERSLQGGTIDLLNAAGDIVESVFAGPHDANGNHQIDADEHGIYLFEEVPVGEYFVRVNSTDDWDVTNPANTDAGAEARRIASAYQLQPAGSSLFNRRSRMEKWFNGIDETGDAATFYILPTGEIILWNGDDDGFVSGRTVGKLTSEFYDDIELLTNPTPLDSARIRVDDSQLLSGPNFGLKITDEVDIDTLMSVWHEQPDN